MNLDNCTAHYRRVYKFMTKAQQPCAHDGIVLPGKEVRKLRAKLIMEETLEQIKALGFDCRGTIYFDRELQPMLHEILDGCADVSVVNVGTMISCGVEDEPLLKLIDDSNMKKFGPGHKFRDDGKLIKPVDWEKPDIQGWIREQNGEEAYLDI